MELQTFFYVTGIVWFILSIIVTIGFTVAAITKPIRRRRRRYNDDIERLEEMQEHMREQFYSLRRELQEKKILDTPPGNE